MKLYHTFQSRYGFNLDQYDFERGLFCIKPWWVGDPRYKDKTAFSPNEFGDRVVEIDVVNNAKAFKASDQIEVLQRTFKNPKSPKLKQIIDLYETGDMDWHKLDKMIGKILRRMRYQMIHYTEDPLYGEAWAIIDRRIIRGIKFEPGTDGRKSFTSDI